MKFEVFTSHLVRSRAIFDGVFFAFDVSCAFLCLHHHRIQRVEQRFDGVEFVLIEGDSSFGGFPHAVVVIQIIMTNNYAAIVVVHFYHHVASDILFEIGRLSSNCVFQLLFQLRQQTFQIGFCPARFKRSWDYRFRPVYVNPVWTLFPTKRNQQCVCIYFLDKLRSDFRWKSFLRFVCFRFHSTTKNCDFLAKNSFLRWIFWSRWPSFSLLCRFSR